MSESLAPDWAGNSLGRDTFLLPDAVMLRSETGRFGLSRTGSYANLDRLILSTKERVNYAAQ